VYVVNQFSNTVSVIDGSTNTVIDTNPIDKWLDAGPVG
jgi:YVTN family beta-propeller protein